MFSSLASFIFGSNTPASTNCDTNRAESSEIQETENQQGIANTTLDEENTIEVTSLTPSVTGASALLGRRGSLGAPKRGKNKRTNSWQNKKTKSEKPKRRGSPSVGGTPAITKLLTPNDSCDEDIDEDEWYIVEKEDEDGEDSSLPRTDSEEEIHQIVEVTKPKQTVAAQQKRLQHINSHSLYSGPRPQKQRNYLQKSRANNNRSSGLSVSTLSPSRVVNVGRNGQAEGGITRSLYVAPSTEKNELAALAGPAPVLAPVLPVIKPSFAEVAANGHGALCMTLNYDEDNLKINNKMEESWFVTPPPCFTSIGPINIQSSPYENLLIEHPSMSVYHSIRKAEESFIKLNLSVKEVKELEKKSEKIVAKQKEMNNRKTNQTIQQRSATSARIDRQAAAQLREEMLTMSVQKLQMKNERKDLRRSAIIRSNKARDVQSRNYVQRRSDRQQYQMVSGANNNRKCSKF